MPRQTHFVGQFILKRFVDCGIAFPNHNASLFDLFTSNPQHPFKASNFSKSFSTNFSLRTKHEVSSTYWNNLYSLLLAFEIYTRYQVCCFLLKLLKFQQQLQKVHQRGQPCTALHCTLIQKATFHNHYL